MIVLSIKNSLDGEFSTHILPDNIKPENLLKEFIQSKKIKGQSPHKYPLPPNFNQLSKKKKNLALYNQKCLSHNGGYILESNGISRLSNEEYKTVHKNFSTFLTNKGYPPVKTENIYFDT